MGMVMATECAHCKKLIEPGDPTIEVRLAASAASGGYFAPMHHDCSLVYIGHWMKVGVNSASIPGLADAVQGRAVVNPHGAAAGLTLKELVNACPSVDARFVSTSEIDARVERGRRLVNNLLSQLRASKVPDLVRAYYFPYNNTAPHELLEDTINELQAWVEGK